ncbi:hypothetical protein B0J17DRAFT_717566 [Rhizoctonia solani]|nr:hypothetical protein B0J17DRAFT_717566 [Rhizoctonia solani]
MPAGSTSPKRSFRSSLKSFFDKRSHNTANQQSEHNLRVLAPGADELTSTSSSRNLFDWHSNEREPTSSQVTSHKKENIQSAASNALEGTLGALYQATEIFPPLQAAVGTLISGLEAVPAAEEHRRSYNNLLTELQTLHAVIDKYRDSIEIIGMTDGTVNIISSIETEAKLLKAKRDKGHMARILNANNDQDDLLQHYRRIEMLSRQLQINIGLGTWSAAYEQLMNTRLGALSPALLAGYNSTLAAEINRRLCTKNTRVAVLDAMDAWSKDNSGANVYWMSGMAGTGKTTIATTLSDTWSKRKQLGASFFCTRTSPECHSIDRVVPTLAYQLARYSRPFQSVLGRVLDTDPDIGTREISLQFKRLLQEPLLEVKDTIPSNIVVIIDALDECSDHSGVKTLLSALFQHASSLPVKFFITSRPEPEIRDEVLSHRSAKREVFHLHDIEKSMVQADIELYLREELDFIPPAEYQIKHLVQLAGNLFIYAATVVRYIRPGKKLANPQARLELVLSVRSGSKKQYAELDLLYSTILDAALDEEMLESVEIEYARRVLWASICAREPIAAETLAEMTQMDREDVLIVLQSFLSVLHLSGVESRVSVFHASFPDFMFDHERSGKYFCDQKLCGQRLALRCFSIMKARLRFNICNIVSSFWPDASLTAIEQRVQTFISPSLLYTCRYWGNHLILADLSPQLVAEIESLLANRLLFWMEVLNLSKSTITGIMELQNTRLWLLRNTSEITTRALALVEDAQDFLASFSASSVSSSTPHIYLSALPFCQISSAVFKNYRPRGVQPVSCMSPSSDGLLIALGDRIGSITILNQSDGSPANSFEAHEEPVECIAFSPDNAQFASGSFDSTIRCWSRNGSPVLGPLMGHKGGVYSLAFSPDGKRIVSGGRDPTVRLWNAQTGSLITSSTLGTDYGELIVTSVLFSPDGAHVIFGSDGGRIRAWDIQQNTIGVFSHSHTAPVNYLGFSLGGDFLLSNSQSDSIRLWSTKNWSLDSRFLDGATNITGMAISPDGARVACVSSFGSLRVWNIADGTVVVGPLEVPPGYIPGQALVFSSDGSRLFSVDHDSAIFMWNIQRGNISETTRDYEGHTGAVNSVAFFSGGTRFISGTDDADICIWNVEDGLLISSFQMSGGHLSEVSTMTFSRDIKLAASSSYDHSIALWDIQHAKHITTFPIMHTNIICSLSFSPNGELIASGSADYTICIWDVLARTLFTGPLRKHTSFVNSVQFAPSSLHVASGSRDQTICLWDAITGHLISQLEGNCSIITSLSYSTDGEYLASGDDQGEFHVWALTGHTTPNLLVSGPRAQEIDAISSLSFSPNSTLIATGSDDGSVNVWDRQSGKLVAGPFKDHSEEVNAVAWSPNGSIIASCSADRTVRLIDLQAFNDIFNWMEGDWDIQNDGWVENQNKLLFWISPDLHPVLPKPYNPLVIGPQGPAQIHYDSLLLGEDWVQCYVDSE